MSTQMSKAKIAHKRGLKKTELCVFFMQDCCPRGDSCGFAHGASELHVLTAADKAKAHLIPSSKKYKTDVCEKWLTTGVCQYFDRCCFLHDARVGLPLAAQPMTTAMVTDQVPSAPAWSPVPSKLNPLHTHGQGRTFNMSGGGGSPGMVPSSATIAVSLPAALPRGAPTLHAARNMMQAAARYGSAGAAGGSPGYASIVSRVNGARSSSNSPTGSEDSGGDCARFAQTASIPSPASTGTDLFEQSVNLTDGSWLWPSFIRTLHDLNRKGPGRTQVCRMATAKTQVRVHAHSRFTDVTQGPDSATAAAAVLPHYAVRDAPYAARWASLAQLWQAVYSSALGPSAGADTPELGGEHLDAAFASVLTSTGETGSLRDSHDRAVCGRDLSMLRLAVVPGAEAAYMSMDVPAQSHGGRQWAFPALDLHSLCTCPPSTTSTSDSPRLFTFLALSLGMPLAPALANIRGVLAARGLPVDAIAPMTKVKPCAVPTQSKCPSTHKGAEPAGKGESGKPVHRPALVGRLTVVLPTRTLAAAASSSLGAQVNSQAKAPNGRGAGGGACGPLSNPSESLYSADSMWYVRPPSTAPKPAVPGVGWHAMDLEGDGRDARDVPIPSRAPVSLAPDLCLSPAQSVSLHYEQRHKPQVSGNIGAGEMHLALGPGFAPAEGTIRSWLAASARETIRQGYEPVPQAQARGKGPGDEEGRGHAREGVQGALWPGLLPPAPAPTLSPLLGLCLVAPPAPTPSRAQGRAASHATSMDSETEMLSQSPCSPCAIRGIEHSPGYGQHEASAQALAPLTHGVLAPTLGEFDLPIIKEDSEPSPSQAQVHPSGRGIAQPLSTPICAQAPQGGEGEGDSEREYTEGPCIGPRCAVA